MYIYILKAFIDITEIIVFLLGVYYLCIAVFSLFSGRRHIEGEKKIEFAVVIPAHNEADTIGSVISSIKNADYPQEKISVLVVADGCSDETASIARMCGADVYIKNHSTTKGDVLKEAFGYLNRTLDYDAAVVFDADNIVDKNFFLEMNDAIAEGKSVVQGYVDSKNSESSWVSYAYSVWYWIYNRISQAGRARLNLGCRLCGTGFVISKKVLEDVCWDTFSAAEDCEYTCMLAERNINVDFCEKAVVYDEKPSRFKESVMQRIRWMQGICDVQGEYTLRLLRKFKINAVLNLWGDLLNTFCFLFLLVSYIFKIGDIWQTTAGALVLWVYIVLYVLTVLTAVLKDKKLSKKMVLNIFGYIIYIFSWIPIGMIGVFSKRRGWYHTKHGDAF